MATFDTSNVLKAIDVIARDHVDNLRLDKTIVAQIVKIINLEIGEYRVLYESNTFSAFASSVTDKYDIGDTVYVRIPQNDMSNRKIIDGRVSGDKTITDIVAEQTAINVVGPTWDQWYPYDKDSKYSVIAGVDDTCEKYQIQIFDRNNFDCASADNRFRDYAKTYNHIRVEASFHTTFIQEFSKGNYGIKVKFNVRQIDESDPAFVEYNLDINNFVGKPYSYTEWSPQYIVLEVQPDYLLGLDSIVLFQNNFDLDYYTTKEGDQYVDHYFDCENNICNIFVQDIKISFAELIDLRNTPYYLDIATPKGITFINLSDKLELVGKLMYQNKNIISQKDNECQWFRENLDITVGRDEYKTYAGSRWEQITDNVDYNKLEISANEVPYHSNYKLMVKYNDYWLSKEVTLFNNSSEYDCGIAQTTQNNGRIYLEIVGEKEGQNLQGDWYFLLPDGSYGRLATKDLPQQQPLMPDSKKIDITSYLIYTSILFYCQIWDGDRKISIENLVVKSSTNESDVIVNYNGQDIYQYDANGDLAFEDTEVDRTLQAKISWTEGFGSAYTITWKDSFGEIIPKGILNKKDIEQSMMNGLWVDFENILHYNIYQKYDLNRNNNKITLVITTVDNHEYSFSKEIIFLKDGDQGTNGSTYICAIRPCDEDGNKLSKYTALKRVGNSWIDEPLNLRCYVYRDGIEINNLKKDNGDYIYDLEFEWDYGGTQGIQKDSNKNKIKPLIYNKVITEKFPRGDVIQVKGNPNITDLVSDYMMKVVITAKKTDKRVNGRWDDNTKLYCYYPIDIAVGNYWNNTGIDRLQQIDMQLPQYIKYSASGINPSYQKSPLICNLLDKDKINDDASIIGRAVLSSLDSNLLTIEDNILVPVEKFLYEESITGIKCDFGSTYGYIIHPVMMYLNTYGNETINGWDGTSIDLGITDDGEDLGRILAPQVGAGTKNSKNQFTGVIMGRQHATAEDKETFGLYGYNEGISTFGFKENGTGYIGASGEGQLIFDGTKKAIIQSGNYSENINGVQSGMKIEFKDGIIKTKSMLLNSSTQQYKFQLGKNGGSLFRIEADNDLSDGFKTLFNVSTNQYYLQSYDYKQATTSLNESGDSNVNGAGTRIDLSNGRITSYNFNLNTPNLTIRSGNDGGTFNFKVIDSGYFKITGPNNTVLMYIGNARGDYATYRLQSLDGNCRIDLGNGHIYATSVNLTGDITATTLNAQKGNIGGWTISSDGLEGGTIKSGIIKTEALTATGGKIGGWSIVNKNLSNGVTTLRSDGLIETSYISIIDGAGGSEIGKIGYGASANNNGTILGMTTRGHNMRLETNQVMNVAGGTQLLLYGGSSSAQISLKSDGIHFNVDANQQHNIYARFA